MMGDSRARAGIFYKSYHTSRPSTILLSNNLPPLPFIHMRAKLLRAAGSQCTSPTPLIEQSTRHCELVG